MQIGNIVAISPYHSRNVMLKLYIFSKSEHSTSPKILVRKMKRIYLYPNPKKHVSCMYKVWFKISPLWHNKGLVQNTSTLAQQRFGSKLVLSGTIMVNAFLPLG